MDNEKSQKEMAFLYSPEDDEIPQEVIDWEQKNSQEESKEEKKDLKEKKDNEQQNLCINDTSEEMEIKVTTENEFKEFKEFKTNWLILNRYWIHLVSKICFFFSIIIYEVIGSFVIVSLFNLFNQDVENIINMIMLIKGVAIKWIFITSTIQHLSIGFFSLTNFSDILKETNKTSKFFIYVILKVLFFYLMSVIILKVIIEDTIFKKISEESNKEMGKIKLPEELKEEVLEVINDIKEITIRNVGNLLGDYNNNLDKLLMGILYITLFSSPNFIKDKYLLFFRLLSIFPIIYIILSLILRSLNNIGKIKLSLYISPLLVGPKFTIFGFFISVLFYIKIKQRKYKMYDEENNLIPSVFAKISSKIFAIFGFIELITGLFFPGLSDYGIGGHYLIILCAPIMILYDYKKKNEIHIRPCKKKDLANCINNSISIIGYIILIFLGLNVFGWIIIIFQEYIVDILQFIIDFYIEIVDILKEI